MRASAVGWIAAIGITLALLPFASTASGQEEAYLSELTAELENSTAYLDQAAAAIAACNDALFACLQNPEPTAREIDNATVGLQSVLANLSAMTVPPRFASAHALLETGFQKVIDGFTLYAAGLRERDVDKLSGGADLVHEGRADITTANNAIFARPAPTVDLVLILVVAVIAAAVAIGVLMFFVGAEARKHRSARIRDDWATCPKCGQVMDRWWTYRTWQIRQWHSDHVKSHGAGSPLGTDSKGGVA